MTPVILEALRPCPFHKPDNKHNLGIGTAPGGVWMVFCGCGACGPKNFSPDMAQASWNAYTAIREVEKSASNTVALLQVPTSPGWFVVSVHETKELAEIEASLRGYPEWSVSEFGVLGGKR